MKETSTLRAPHLVIALEVREARDLHQIRVQKTIQPVGSRQLSWHRDSMEMETPTDGLVGGNTEVTTSAK